MNGWTPAAVEKSRELAEELELRPEVRVIDRDTVEVRSTSRPWLVYRMERTPDGFVHAERGCEDEQFRGPLGCRHTRKAENATMSENAQTALTVRQQAVTPVGLNFTPQQMTVFKDQICKGASEAEIQMAMAICYRTGLDPFLKQIAFMMRWDGKLKRETMVPVVMMDGFRLLSERSGHYAGMDAIEWLDEDGVWSQVWTAKGRFPVAARCTVYRTDSPRPVVAVCKWDSYVQTNSDGKPNASWSRMPDVMIGNAAERLARRRAYPAETAGVTVDEEMDAAPAHVVEGVIEGTVVDRPPEPGSADDDFARIARNSQEGRTRGAPQQASPARSKATIMHVKDALTRLSKELPAEDYYQLKEDFMTAFPVTVAPDGKWYPQRLHTDQIDEALSWLADWEQAHAPAGDEDAPEDAASPEEAETASLPFDA